jgi:hypothetical protein
LVTPKSLPTAVEGGSLVTGLAMAM